jgi:hypothetical protein
MSKKKLTMFRQGDVLIVKDARAHAQGVAVPKDAGRVVLAYGEVTGHAHAIRSRSAQLFEAAPKEDRTTDGDRAWARASRILQVSAKAGVELRHEEHATIPLPPGNYRIVQQREWSIEDEARNVAD